MRTSLLTLPVISARAVKTLHPLQRRSTKNNGLATAKRAATGEPYLLVVRRNSFRFRVGCTSHSPQRQVRLSGVHLYSFHVERG